MPDRKTIPDNDFAQSSRKDINMKNKKLQETILSPAHLTRFKSRPLISSKSPHLPDVAGEISFYHLGRHIKGDKNP
jgi:hypothetical protein